MNEIRLSHIVCVFSLGNPDKQLAHEGDAFSFQDTKLVLEIMSIHFVTLGYEQLCYFMVAVSLRREEL